MHYEILVEGQCELTTLSYIMKDILGEYRVRHTWKIHKHQGVGKIPINPQILNPKDRSLLGQLPAKIRAYNNVIDENRVVIVLIDLDCANKEDLLNSLNLLLPKEEAFNIRFCFAAEELESWFLADIKAILESYPNANKQVHHTYIQDSICGTWEVLSKVLGSNIDTLPKRDQRVLKEKCEWAKNISPNLDVNINASPSFQHFKSCLLDFSI